MVKPYLSSAYKDKDSLIAGWRDIHVIITNKSGETSSVTDLLGYALYYYTVYKAFGQEQDASRAKELLEQLLQQLAHYSVGSWSSAQLDEVVTLAWLYAEFVEQGIAKKEHNALLVELDHRLLAQAGLLLQHEASSVPDFLRIVRYFCLRHPGQPLATNLLTKALAQKTAGFWPSLVASSPDLDGAESVTRLGLADGLAGELLLLIRLAETGAAPQLDDIREQVHQGIVYILSAKREVDFSERKYAIFPDYIANDQDEATFSNELSWRHGDLGQALLLYTSHKLLQDPELLRLAELVGLNTLLRTDVRSTAVTNSRFSSGAAGVAHLYRTLYQLSGHDAYRKGYAFWLTQTRNWLTTELNTDFYRHHEGDLLHGLVGVGLVLLSAISEQELPWDRALL
ncbi:lanthionine synthetase LanC family protein [Hymenobacter lucidus]|uniref:Lanthionine synthetase C-like protein n=1 Tax=Hymenobacter lucidus TaxID=2880930 RepID=A0ABS8AUC4_9BACT|nr:lanthionine synthetase LanC family protein [Hymenobacter lucidus]MCB2409830.1 hypothetical protein [Hymenobacter lucidus]